MDVLQNNPHIILYVDDIIDLIWSTYEHIFSVLIQYIKKSRVVIIFKNPILTT